MRVRWWIHLFDKQLLRKPIVDGIRFTETRVDGIGHTAIPLIGYSVETKISVLLDQLDLAVPDISASGVSF